MRNTLPFACSLAITFALAGCDAFVSEVTVAITNPEYIVLRPVTTEPISGGSSAKVYGQTLYFRAEERILDLRHLAVRTAEVNGPRDPGGTYVIAIQTTSEGASLLREWTARNIEKQLGIFVDGQLISAPVIKTTISDTIVLDGDFTKQQAEGIVERLRRGGALN